MRKVFLTVIFILALLVLTPTAFCAEKKVVGGVVRTEIETKDEFTLVGDFYPSRVRNKKMPLVFLLHSFGGKSTDWGQLPEKIVKGGYNVFALDLRGHGRSVYTADLKYRTYKPFTDKTWVKLPKDVLEVINYLKETYSKVDYTKIIFVGADLGANTAILAGDKLNPKPVKMVLISPAQSFKGLYIPIVISNYSNTPMLTLASSTDKYFANQAKMLSRFIQSAQILKLYPKGGSGTILLKQNPAAYDDIVKFIYK